MEYSENLFSPTIQSISAVAVNIPSSNQLIFSITTIPGSDWPVARWIWEAGGWWIPHRVTNSSRCLAHTQEDSWFQSDLGTSSGNDSLCLDWRLGNSFESLEMFSPKQIELHKTLFSFWYWNLCSTTIELQIPVIHATHCVKGCQKKIASNEMFHWSLKMVLRVRNGG